MLIFFVLFSIQLKQNGQNYKWKDFQFFFFIMLIKVYAKKNIYIPQIDFKKHLFSASRALWNYKLIKMFQ